MTSNLSNLSLFSVCCAALALLSGCTERSSTTGMTYNDPKSGGFEYHPYAGQETGPGLVFVQGGAFKMGQTTDDVMYDWDNKRRTVTVSSFYMDETEVSNAHYREYLHWLARVHGDERIEIVNRAKPDTAAWRRKLGYNENYVKYYFRHPAYQDYPVVGVSWLQATDYCKWRTDRVNEYILIREELLVQSPPNVGTAYFTTDAYYQYPDNITTAGYLVPGVRNLNEEANTYPPPVLPNAKKSGRNRPNKSNSQSSGRHIIMEDGMLLPEYRLPTEAEWEYAALGLIGATERGKDFQNSGRIYPWAGTSAREQELRWANNLRNGDNVSMSRGDFKANFMRGSGDMMGIANGPLNDGADITAPVKSYAPNDYGLYNMAGNVSEWVMDVYRPLNSMDMEAHRPHRGNQFQTLQTDAKGATLEQYEVTEYDTKLLKAELKAYVEKGKGKFSQKENDFLDKVLAAIDATDSLIVLKESEKAWNQLEAFVDRELRDPQNPDPTIQIIPTVYQFFSRNVTAVPGNVRMRPVRVEENLTRDNYRESNYIDYLDGDSLSGLFYNGNNYQYFPDLYETNSNSLISDRKRVYKGGGWDDRQHYLSPGTRRYLDESKSSASIGFRCAMDRLGPPLELTDY
jgi:gliding motility-associated lipoprotein GldJ